MRRHLLAPAALALLLLLAGCSADSSAPSPPAPAAVTKSPVAAPSHAATTKAAVKAANYPTLAKRYIAENVCITGPDGCSDIKRYGLIGGYALVAYTDLYPDSDAAAPARSICSYLLMYVNDSKVSSDDLASTAYVYGSTGSKITSCASPVDR